MLPCCEPGACRGAASATLVVPDQAHMQHPSDHGSVKFQFQAPTTAVLEPHNPIVCWAAQEHTLARMVHSLQSSLWPGGTWFQRLPQRQQPVRSLAPVVFRDSVLPELCQL